VKIVAPPDWHEGRGQRLTVLGMQDDTTGKILAAQFFPSETTFGYLCLLRQVRCNGKGRRFQIPQQARRFSFAGA
jgi:hypothetical protein